jgi:hypothetical protein
MSTQILLRRGTAAQWTSNGTVVLAAGEPGFETDSGQFKIGNGTLPWTDLPYAVVVPTDISDLTDLGSLIPQDLSDLTDNTGRIPTDIGNFTDVGNRIPVDISDLTDTTSLIPVDINDLTDTTSLIPQDLSDLTDNTGRIPADISELNDSTFRIPTDISNLTDLTNRIPEALTDLGISNGNAGQVLTAIGNGNFAFETLPSIPQELDDFDDVNIIEAAQGEVLRYNGTSWSNGPFPPDDDTKYDITAEASGTGGATITLAGTDTVTHSFDIVQSTTRPGVLVSVVNNNVELGMNTGLISFDGGYINNYNSELALSSATGRIATGFVGGTAVEVTNAVGSGTVVTMVFNEEDIAPFAVGSTISVSGMTPINYNGEFTVASCTTTQVTFNSSVTAAFVSGGAINGTKLADNGSLLIGLPFYDATRPAINIFQAHETAAAMNISFTRSRGTSVAQEILQNGDALGGIAAVGRGTSALVGAASIGFAVEGSPGANVPGKIQFATNNGTAFGLRAEISPTGQLKVNSITSLTGNLVLNATGGNVQLPVGTTVGGVAIGTISIQGIEEEVGDLPTTGNTVGDAYVVENVIGGGPSTFHLWNGTLWRNIGNFQGPAGQGVPTGGTVGQVLAKTTGSNYATQWVTPFDGNYGSLFGSPNLATVATSGQFADLLGKPNLATVATSGDYDDLINLPVIPAAQVNADWNATTGLGAIFNKPTIPQAPVNADWNSTSGLSEILNKPNFANIATSGSYEDLLFTPTFAAVATSGSYVDLTNKPTIPAEQVNADWNATTGKAAILNKPTIPAAPVNADWNSSTGLSQILNKPAIPSDLTDLGIVDGTVGQVLTTNGSGTFTFTTVTSGGGATTLDGLSDVVITGTPTNGQVLKYNGTNWVNGTDATGGAGDGNTTYGISAETATGGVNLRLTGSDSSTDNVKLTAGTNITLTRTSADEITIAAAGGGGGGLVSRAAVSAASSSLANNAVGPINITGYKAYALLKVQTSAAAWVRIYTSEAARQADASRTEGTDPLPGSGVIAEVITTGAQTVLISPGTIGFNDETVVTTNIPVRVTNKSGSTQAITVTLTAIQLEA